MDALLSPALGTIIWASIAFIIVLILLRKMAWGPILKGLKEREESIAGSLNEAERARQEFANLKADNEQLLQDARNERDAILKEGRELKESIIADAKSRAKQEADKIVANAREEVVNEKNAALAELKSHVALLSLNIAEKVLRSNLSNDEKQTELVGKLLEETDLN